MKTSGCLLLILLFISVSAIGQQAAAPEHFASSGNAFLRVCEATEDTAQNAAWHLACTAYVNGVSDGAGIMGERFHQFPYCEPPNAENGQEYRIVVKYIKEHPEKANLQTRVLIVDALIATFPCHLPA